MVGELCGRFALGKNQDQKPRRTFRLNIGWQLSHFDRESERSRIGVARSDDERSSGQVLQLSDSCITRGITNAVSGTLTCDKHTLFIGHCWAGFSSVRGLIRCL